MSDVHCTLYTVQCIPVVLSCVLWELLVFTQMAVAAPLIVVPVAEGSSVPDVV